MNVGAVYKWASRVIEEGQDRSGMQRWTYLTKTLKGVKIAFVMAYRVCKQMTFLEKTQPTCNNGEC